MPYERRENPIAGMLREVLLQVPFHRVDVVHRGTDEAGDQFRIYQVSRPKSEVYEAGEKPVFAKVTVHILDDQEIQTTPMTLGGF